MQAISDNNFFSNQIENRMFRMEYFAVGWSRQKKYPLIIYCQSRIIFLYFIKLCYRFKFSCVRQFFGLSVGTSNKMFIRPSKSYSTDQMSTITNEFPTSALFKMCRGVSVSRTLQTFLSFFS